MIVEARVEELYMGEERQTRQAGSNCMLEALGREGLVQSRVVE